MLKKFLFFLTLSAYLFANKGLSPIIQNDILNKEVEAEIKALSMKIYDKTGIFLGILISNNGDFQNNIKKARQIALDYEQFAILILNSKIHRLTLINSENLENTINKDKLLNFYYFKWGFFPSQGAILPLISSPKVADSYNAGVLNGFEELCTQIATANNLDIGISSANSEIFSFFRLVFYIIVCISIFMLFKRKFKNAKK